MPPSERPVFSRRTLVGGVAATLGALSGATLLAGCKPCLSPWPPAREFGGPRPGPRTLTLRARIQPNQFHALRAILDDPSLNPFQTNAWGIHYVRLFTTSHDSLYFMVIYDDYWDAIAFLSKNAEGVDRVFRLCADYPVEGAIDHAGLDAFVRSHLVCVQLYYRAYDNPQFQVRNALELRDEFLRFVQRSEIVPEEQLRTLYAEFLANRALTNMAVDVREVGQPGGDGIRRDDMRLVSASGSDSANPFTLLARVDDKQLGRLRRLLQLGTYANLDLGIRPLANLPTLHFARVSIVEGNKLLFASVYDGDFIQYVEDFGTRIANEIDTVFGACIGYPIAGSRDVAQFKVFLRSNQVVTNAFGGPYLARSLLQIKSSLALASKLDDLCKRVDSHHPGLRKQLDRFVYENQQLLT